MVQEIESKEVFSDILKNNKVVIVDFFATWCGPCKVIAPLLEDLEKELDGKVTFVKIDVEKCMDLAQEHNVSAMPTFFIFKDGKLEKEIVGANMPKIKTVLGGLIE